MQNKLQYAHLVAQTPKLKSHENLSRDSEIKHEHIQERNDMSVDLTERTSFNS